MVADCLGSSAFVAHTPLFELTLVPMPFCWHALHVRDGGRHREKISKGLGWIFSGKDGRQQQVDGTARMDSWCPYSSSRAPGQ
jgi:hypothetical protein